MYNQKTELTEAQKKAAAFAARRIAFEPKSASTLAAEASAEAAEAVASNQIGYKIPDGSVYAGVSPDTHQPMFLTTTNPPLMMSFNKAAEFAKDLDIYGHKDWRLPTWRELTALYQNKERGSLKGAFDQSGKKSSWYWSSEEAPLDRPRSYSEKPIFMARARTLNFSNGRMGHSYKDFKSAVCCVRG